MPRCARDVVDGASCFLQCPVKEEVMRVTFHLAAAVAATLSATAVAAAQTGNGAPSGPHFNLNIIGVSHDKNPNMNGKGSGSVIFVALGTKSGAAVTTKI